MQFLLSRFFFCVPTLTAEIKECLYSYGPEEQCCDAVVDIVSLLSAIGAIGAVSLFLRQAVIDNMIKVVFS